MADLDRNVLTLWGISALLMAGLVIATARLGRLARIRKLVGGLDSPLSPAEVDLASRLRALETRVARLEAERSGQPRSDPAAEGSTSGRRADAGRPWGAARRAARRDDEPVLIALPNLAGAGARGSAEALAEFDRRFGAVWTLADEGLGDDEIAARTGYPAGQVELILGLRRPAGAPPSPPPTRAADPTPPEHPPRGDDPDG